MSSSDSDESGSKGRNDIVTKDNRDFKAKKGDKVTKLLLVD